MHDDFCTFLPIFLHCMYLKEISWPDDIEAKFDAEYVFLLLYMCVFLFNGWLLGRPCIWSALIEFDVLFNLPRVFFCCSSINSGAFYLKDTHRFRFFISFSFGGREAVFGCFSSNKSSCQVVKRKKNYKLLFCSQMKSVIETKRNSYYRINVL